MDWRVQLGIVITSLVVTAAVFALRYRFVRPRSDRKGEESAAAPAACVFRREGEYWTLAYRGQTARLRDTKGLHYIACLLAQPGRDVHVRDLAAMKQGGGKVNGSGPVCVEGDLGAILDARATAQYKQRLAEARQEFEAATAAGDLGQAERARHEIESITEQLAAAYGFGGRPRLAGDPAERMRKAVTNQIRRALERIRATHPDLGQHLTNALRTGFVCAYRPEHAVAWRLASTESAGNRENVPEEVSLAGASGPRGRGQSSSRCSVATPIVASEE